MRHKALVLSLLTVMVGGLSCDRATRPLTTGSIAIQLITPGGQAALVGASAPGVSADVTPAEGGPATANITLTGIRVTVTGPTSRTLTSTTVSAGGNFDVTITDLDVGSYTVTVEGLVNNAVSNFGQTSNVNVTAGTTTPATISFQSFQPTIPTSTVVDTSDVLHFTVNWNAVAGATNYIVSWSLNADMSGAQTKTVSTTSTDIQVTSEGKYYVTVRAVNSVVSTGGLPSPTKGVYVFQGVATVVVTPATPSITYGATQQFTAEARDADNVVVANVNWFWASSNHTVATVTQSGLVTAVAPGTAQITAVGKGTPGSATITVTAPATKLAFSVQPTTTVAGQTITAVKVAVQNALSQTVTTDNTTQVTVALATNTGGGTLAGAGTVTVAAGVATFNFMNINKTGSAYTLSASATNLTSATSSAFDIIPGAPAQLAFTVNPSASVLDDAISPAIQVEIRDATGNLVTGARDPIVMAVGTNPGSATLNGVKVVNAVGGIATFGNLSMSAAGIGYTLSASSGALTAAVSSTFDVAASGAATQVVFTAQPKSAVSQQAIAPAIGVALKDAKGRIVAGDNSTQVTLAIGTNAGTGTLTNGGSAVVTNGVATFPTASIDKAGTNYTLTISASGLTGATSDAFDIAPGSATQLAFSIPPATAVAGEALSPAVQVEVRDNAANRVTSSRDAITIAIGANPSIGAAGTLTGTKVVNAINGIASFTGIWINKTGTGYTLAASATGLSGATSSAFNVTPAAPAKLAFVQQPTNVAGATVISPAITVSITDQFENATTATNSITMGFDNNPWKTVFAPGGTLFGTATRVATSGVATFNNLSVDKPGLAYTLRATSGSLTAATSSEFNVNLSFTQVVAASNGSHTCGITSSATYCWGYNGQGQLGFPTSVGNRDSIAAIVRTNQAFVEVTTGANHSCGRTAAGAVYCWGYNGNGQLGNNSTSASDVPVAVAGGHTFASIDAGAAFTCGITTSSLTASEDRQVYCWGYNGNGQIGDGLALGTTTQYLTPNRVVNPLQTITHATQISAGYQHACARAADTNIYCWGYNYYGQLGNNTTFGCTGGCGTSIATPQQVVNLTGWTSVSAGSYHTCAIRFVHLASSPVDCWGYNGNGQLGNGNNTTSNVPVEASNLNWISVGAGDNTSCAVLSNGAAYCWGYDGNGQLGDGTFTTINTPVQVSGSNVFTDITVGANHTCGRTASAVFCWGYNGTGQLGSPGTGQSKNTPTQVIQ